MYTIFNKLSLLFDERCKGLKVLFIAILFGCSTSLFATPNINFDFASGDLSLTGGDDCDDCDDDDQKQIGCSQKKLNKGYVNICEDKDDCDDDDGDGGSCIKTKCKKPEKADKLLAKIHKNKTYYLPINFYQDSDMDGFGDENAVATLACSAPDGSVDNNHDCDDTNSVINPEASDSCGDFGIIGVNDDCSADGIADGGASDRYLDFDNDSDFSTLTTYSCDDGSTIAGTDCDDFNPLRAGTLDEICGNAIDDDCDANTPDFSSGYLDSDGDGYGELGSSLIQSCDENLADSNDDCNDGEPLVNPGATEVQCDGIDNDCNADTSDNDGGQTVYLDMDGDGFGDVNVTSTALCEVIPDGYVLDSTDCYDASSGVNPGADEVCNDGIDNNCNNEVDEDCSVLAECPCSFSTDLSSCLFNACDILGNGDSKRICFSFDSGAEEAYWNSSNNARSYCIDTSLGVQISIDAEEYNACVADLNNLYGLLDNSCLLPIEP